MEQWLRDELAKEQGYTICPLVCDTYIHCDNKCEFCDYYIDFLNSIVENNKKDKKRNEY